MELKDTVDLMLSGKYKERMQAEYLQTKIRLDKLHKMTVRYEAGALGYTPECALETLLRQERHMRRYLRDLEIRAEIEGIDLEVYDE